MLMKIEEKVNKLDSPVKLQLLLLKIKEKWKIFSSYTKLYILSYSISLILFQSNPWRDSTALEHKVLEFINVTQTA